MTLSDSSLDSYVLLLQVMIQCCDVVAVIRIFIVNMRLRFRRPTPSHIRNIYMVYSLAVKSDICKGYQHG